MAHRLAAVLSLVAALMLGLVWPGEGWSQTKLPRVGVLNFPPGSDTTLEQWLAPFRRMLAAQGFVEGKNVALEFRSARSDPAQLAEAAAELARLKVDVIWAPGAPFVRAAFGATRTIPIIGMDFTTDPVLVGYAQSYARPGGNLTGVFLDVPDFSGKWMELLKAIIPDVSRLAVIWDPTPGRTHLEAVQRLAHSMQVSMPPNFGRHEVETVTM